MIDTSLLLKLLPLLLSTLATIIVLWPALLIGFRILQRRRALHRETIFLEITPPAHTARSARSTQELFSVIHGFRAARSFIDKLLHREVILSFEIASTREYGIRYLIQTNKRQASSLSQVITSYSPDIKVTEVRAPIFDEQAQIMEFKQTEHYAFPLATHELLEQHDPVAYLTGMMTKLESNECITFQIILSPVRLREASILAHRILGNEDLLTKLSGHKASLLPQSLALLSKAATGLADTIGEVHHGTTKQSYTSSRANYEGLQVAKRQRPSRTLSAFELEIMELMHRKLNQPLFRVSLRASVSATDPRLAREKLSALKSSLQSYSAPPYQALSSRSGLTLAVKRQRHAFIHRLPALFARHSMVLSAGEIASLYHFPIGANMHTDNLMTSLSKTLPAPISLKQNKQLDVIIGQNEHHGVSTPIGLTEAERERHVYIIGGTGNGKTTMLEYQIVQDINNDKGFAIVDPHGDLADGTLGYVSSERIKDVVYFNPDDLEYPVGINLLELTPGLSGNELLREKDIITESVVSVFRKIFSEDDSGGHRIEYVLRNTVHTALTVENATLFTVLKLLQNATYRKSVTDKLEDEDLKDFWKNELGQAGNMQRVKMSAGVTAKIGRFNSNAAAKLILGQAKSTIDFEDIINSGKILICNFSKGLLGEDVSELFGITVLAKLQLASLRRARLRQQERRAFHLYVDEFQNFATPSFVQMLSESRKYRLFMTMAEQSTSQQKDQKMVDIILANVGTVVCFRTGNPQDERLLLPLFSPYIEPGEIANLPSFNFYAKLSAIYTQEPLSGNTLLLPDEGNETIAQEVVTYSREHYTGKVEEVVLKERSAKSKTRKRETGPKKTKKARLPGEN
jgi:hypothetical protein